MDAAAHERFHLKSVDDLATAAGLLGLTIPLAEDISNLFEKVPIAGESAPNRFMVHPMEGFDSLSNGAPGELTFRRYRRCADGGFGSIWMEATATVPEGRSNPRQLWLHKDNVHVFRDLVNMIRLSAHEFHGRDVILVLQLTHSGRYSKPTGVPEPIIAHHSPILDPKVGVGPDHPLVTDEYLDRLQTRYVEAARLAAEAGLDGVDIKSCHRYLVSELLASFTREGPYGGSLENRSRFLLETASRIMESVPGIFVTTRMNAYDAIEHPYGFGVDENDYRVPDLREPLEVAAKIRALGAPLLNVSIGNPYFNPHYGRPFDFPTCGGNVPDDHPLRGLDRILRITRQFQEAAPELPVVATGYSWLRQFMPNVAAAVIGSGGATLLGIGRGAFAYPDTVRDLAEKGRMDPAKCCVTCSGCTQLMRDGGRTGCVVRDSEIYGPEYRLARRFALDHLQEQARRCRYCEEATCSRDCPAGVDVPGFIRAFADSDFDRAYNILREANVLPEMCGFVCPSDVQCEGGCLEKIFCDVSLPIRDIQLLTCRIARRRGIVGVRLPDVPSGRRVATVGGGPAGIACAITLLEQGHHVTIFDRSSRLGGVPDSVIPEDRYGVADDEVQAALEPALVAGRVLTCLGQELGRDIQLSELQSEYDAVLLAMGLSVAGSIGAADGVTDAVTFLRKLKSGEIDKLPARVAVVGGGNTAVDAAVTARSSGAADVYLVYRRSFAEMPAWPKEKERLIASGCHVLILTQPIAYNTDESGRLTNVTIARTELGETDASGRRRPSIVPDSESRLDVDLVIEAIGQAVSEALKDAMPGIHFASTDVVATLRPGSFATHLKGVFAAGDIVNGGTTAVRGVAEGMKAAEEIDAFISSLGDRT